MTCGIYKIENKINGKIYIGQSLNIEERWKAHKVAGQNNNHKYKNYPLYKDMHKYKLNNFEFLIIEKCLKEELDEKEIYWIQYYDSFYNGYNQTKGGAANFAHPMQVPPDKLLNIIYDLKNTNLTTIQLGEKYSVSKDTISSINTGKSWFDEKIEYPIRKNNIIKTYCKICGKEISSNNKSKICNNCLIEEYRKENWPDRETLKNLIRTIPFTQIGKIYGVTDNASRKWCDYYGLPRRKSDINKISDEEWKKL